MIPLPLEDYSVDDSPVTYTEPAPVYIVPSITPQTTINTQPIINETPPTQPTVTPTVSLDEILTTYLPPEPQPTQTVEPTQNNMLSMSDIPGFIDASQGGGGSSYASSDYNYYGGGGGGGVIAAPNSEPQPTGSVLDQILSQVQQNAGTTTQTQTDNTATQVQTTNAPTPAIALADSPTITWIKNNKLIVGAGIALIAWLVFSGGGSRAIRVIRES